MLVLWLIVAVVAGIAEVTTTGLFMATVSFAALLTAIFSLGVTEFPVQLAVFSALSLAGLVLIRPMVIHLLGIHYVVDQGRPLTDHFIDQRAVVTRQVDNFGGQVRIGQAEFWTARASEPGDVIPPGTPVTIQWIDGVTAIVLRAPDEGPHTLGDGPAIDITGNKGA